MKKKRIPSLNSWRAAAFCLLLLALSQTAIAATLRGRLDRRAPNGAIYPAPGIAVTVYRRDLGRSSPSYSGADGMYYLNVAAGRYPLEIWISRDPRVRPLVYQIQVKEPYTDIAEILLP